MNLFVENSIKENTLREYQETLPEIVPYLTFEEYCKYTGNPSDLTPIEYI